jgi:type II secretory pathway pseudopilin PulG
MLEVLVVTGVLLIVSMLVFPMSLNQISQNKVKSASNNFTSLIFNVQQDAYAGKDDSSYGVVFVQNGIRIYQGDSFAQAISQEFIELPDDVSIGLISLSSGTSEVNFPKGGYLPNSFGTVQVQDENNSYQIVINKQGLIYDHEI